MNIKKNILWIFGLLSLIRNGLTHTQERAIDNTPNDQFSFNENYFSSYKRRGESSCDKSLSGYNKDLINSDTSEKDLFIHFLHEASNCEKKIDAESNLSNLEINQKKNVLSEIFSRKFLKKCNKLIKDLSFFRNKLHTECAVELPTTINLLSSTSQSTTEQMISTSPTENNYSETTTDFSSTGDSTISSSSTQNDSEGAKSTTEMPSSSENSTEQMISTTPTENNYSETTDFSSTGNFSTIPSSSTQNDSEEAMSTTEMVSSSENTTVQMISTTSTENNYSETAMDFASTSDSISSSSSTQNASGEVKSTTEITRSNETLREETTLSPLAKSTLENNGSLTTFSPNMTSLLPSFPPSKDKGKENNSWPIGWTIGLAIVGVSALIFCILFTKNKLKSLTQRGFYRPNDPENNGSIRNLSSSEPVHLVELRDLRK